ncbi:MAG TPA: SusE domain-containing protein [Flavobacterium sp.]
MKKTLKLSALALLLSMTIGCENDDQTTVQATGGPELLTPTDGSSYVLSPVDAENEEAMTLVWDHARYDQETAANYAVEVATAGTGFAAVVDGLTGLMVTDALPLTMTSSRFSVLTVDKLNDIAIASGIAPFESGDLEIRIKSWLGNNISLVQYSNSITITVTPYTTETPRLYLRGNFTAGSGYGPNWGDNTTPPFIGAEAFGSTNFEGYIYMNDAAPEFKMMPTSADFSGDYGDADGSGATGVLVQEGESNIKAPGAGYYWVKANTDPAVMTYSLTETDWAVIGSATPGGWDNDTDMTYNPATKVWTVVLTLTTGEIKFRANDAWAINYGDAGTNGTLDFNDGTNIPVTAGTYLITLDLSNPRAYTYTLTAQ